MKPMAVTLSITAPDGTVYTDPGQIRIPRNENTEAFYQILENYIPEQGGRYASESDNQKK